MIYSHDYDIIAITETWLSDNVFDNEILPTNYTIYRKDRKFRGGGVMLAVKNTIHSHILSVHPELEVLSVCIGSNDPTIICLVYNPPNSTEECLLTLFDYIRSTANLCNDKLILIGDFNFPSINWDLLQGNTPITNSFCDLIFDLNLTQLIDQPTHSGGNILDLVLTNIENSITSLTIQSANFLTFNSDHSAITFCLNIQSSPAPKTSPYYVFDYFKGDYEGLRNHLANIDFSPCLQSHDIEYIWSFIESSVITAMNLFIPQIKIHNHPQPKWYTSEIKHILELYVANLNVIQLSIMKLLLKT